MLLFLVLCCLLPNSEGRSDGAPCDVLRNTNLSPSHAVPSGGNLAMTPDTGRYSISVDGCNNCVLQGGQTYTVRLSGQPKGFVIRISDDGLTDHVSSVTDSTGCSQMKSCADGRYLTHRTASPCDVSFQWTAPSGVNGNMKFQSTAVETYSQAYYATKYFTITPGAAAQSNDRQANAAPQANSNCKDAVDSNWCLTNSNQCNSQPDYYRASCANTCNFC